MTLVTKANLVRVVGSLVLCAILWPLNPFRYLAACLLVLALQRLDMWAIRNHMVPSFFWPFANDEPTPEEPAHEPLSDHPYRPEPSAAPIPPLDPWRRFKYRVLGFWPWR